MKAVPALSHPSGPSPIQLYVQLRQSDLRIESFFIFC